MSENKRAWRAPNVLAGLAGAMGAAGMLGLAGMAGVIPLQKPDGWPQPMARAMQGHAPVSTPVFVRPRNLVPMAAAVPLASSWRLDHTLSLNLLKSHEPVRARMADDEQTGAQRAEVDPPPTVAQADPKVNTRVNLDGSGLLMIDPPAAGQMQSSANQAMQTYRRAQDLVEQGRDGQALDVALQALKLDARQGGARRLAISLALEQKQLDQAQSLIEEGLKLTPQDGELLYWQARHLAATGASEQALNVLQGLEQPDGEALGLKAGLLVQAGRYAPAAMAYQQALKTRPDNARWWLGLGVALNAQGQGAVAKEAFLRARRLGQLSPDVQAWLDQQL